MNCNTVVSLICKIHITSVDDGLFMNFGCQFVQPSELITNYFINYVNYKKGTPNSNEKYVFTLEYVNSNK